MVRHGRGRLLGGVALMFTALSSAAQEASSDAKTSDMADVVVVGSRIKGARSSEALPVTILSPDQVEATGAVTGDDLLRTIPEMGGVAFNPTNGQQTSNSARGDVASIDLRGAGIGNTLVLLNGRRIVGWPTSQSKGGVPLLSYNAESLPVANLDRLEVLRDGAGAIYGSDAVAGVVNAVTRTNFDGFKVTGEYGVAEGTHLSQYSESIVGGHSFDQGRGNVSFSLDLIQRSAERPSDEPYTANQDLRPYFAGYPTFASSSAPDNRSNQSSWPAIVALGVTGPVKQGATSLTTAAGSFHIQPSTLSGCLTQIGNGLCIGSGSVPYTSTANSLRYNAAANDYITTLPAVQREIGELNAEYQFSDRFTAYSEIDYYHAASQGLTTQGTTIVAVGVPASNYYNPFGPVTFANGQANPNRLPNLTNVPASGLPLTIATYRFNDLGPDPVHVDSSQSRYLVGAKGSMWGFDWDSALLYSHAENTDSTGSIDSRALARQLALSTPDAYDPFNGSCLNGAGGGDCTPSSQTALNAIAYQLKRVSASSLGNGDFKVTRSDLLSLPGGPLGIAAGVEARIETHSDHRDPLVDGSTPFVDPVSGLVSASNATGVSVTPSTSGQREVYSSYVEFAVPVVSPEMGVPLIRSLNLQLAGRYEYYSDFGSVAKPKAAAAWELLDGVRLRGSYQQGFKAPNLETTDPFSYARAQGVTDYYRCQADLLKHKISSFGACTDTLTVNYFESGNPGLKPEDSDSYSFGVVLQPDFLPARAGKLTLSADQWLIYQQATVGVDGVGNLSALDYLSRAAGGSGNANVIRAAPNADDIAQFAGSGLSPVGAITQINDTFKNLQPQTIRGVDFALDWRNDFDNWGFVDANIDATWLREFYQSTTTDVQTLYSARSAGTINAAVPLTSGGSQIKLLGNPKWRGTASLTWRLDPFQVGISTVYTGATLDSNFISTTGQYWPVKSMLVTNAYWQYSFKNLFAGSDLKWRIGARDLFNAKPPIESDGYNGALYVPYRRYLYTSLSAAF